MAEPKDAQRALEAYNASRGYSDVPESDITDLVVDLAILAHRNAILDVETLIARITMHTEFLVPGPKDLGTPEP